MARRGEEARWSRQQHHETGRPTKVIAGPATAPSVSLPKGGGALRGIGETFGVQIPVPAPQGRSGFGPSLTLSYDSGAGNGPFGLGWSLGLGTVTRKTCPERCGTPWRGGLAWFSP
ncbi:SpvB/TcaC N-terminal domain-containing protein [Streptomyces pristinaespiralis]|uniref:SpvB/TcaC N-terminal domain-containing protein n=1 Tax=Streptomyces pristinaespiralis TaxID=38300 RepID=UPI00384D6F6F